jgi:hypothetical protein
MTPTNDLQYRAQRYRRLAEMLSLKDAAIVMALASELEAAAEMHEPSRRPAENDKRTD